MVKMPASTYSPGKRGKAWLKVKKALATLDVVVTAVEWGHGKRNKMLSDYTFAVLGPDGSLLNVGKAYSGYVHQCWVQSAHPRGEIVHNSETIRTLLL